MDFQKHVSYHQKLESVIFPFLFWSSLRHMTALINNIWSKWWCVNLRVKIIKRNMSSFLLIYSLSISVSVSLSLCLFVSPLFVLGRQSECSRKSHIWEHMRGQLQSLKLNTPPLVEVSADSQHQLLNMWVKWENFQMIPAPCLSCTVDTE